nr:hypothetical protein [Pseudoalteromonas sp. WY3]
MTDLYICYEQEVSEREVIIINEYWSLASSEIPSFTYSIKKHDELYKSYKNDVGNLTSLIKKRAVLVVAIQVLYATAVSQK